MDWLRTLARSRWTPPLALLAFSQWEVWLGGPTHLVGPRWAAAASLAVGSATLVGRRRAPLTTQVAAAVVTCIPWLVWGSSQVGSSFLIGVMSTYAVGRWGDRPAAYLGMPVGAAWAALQIARDPLQEGVSTGWGWVLYAVVAWGAGAWVRLSAETQNRRDAERVNLSRAELAEQRLGIARDLHDMLANSLAVIVVHAEAAEEVLVADPAQAAKALQRVQASGRDALREVRALLAPLRDGEGSNAPAPDRWSTARAPDRWSTARAPDRWSTARPPDRWSTARPPDRGATPEEAPLPRPGLPDVDELVDRMRAAGLPVEVSRRECRGLPPEVGEVVYRILQESLANTVRHAGLVPTHVALEVGARAVSVDIEDDGVLGTSLTTTGGGTGLEGMRQRVERLGGALHAAPRADGGFAVHASIPLEDLSSGSAAEPRPLRRPAATELPR